MNVTVFSTQPFERDYLLQANADRHHLQLLEAGLSANTAPLAQGSQAISVFTADDVSAAMLEQLWEHGVRAVLVRATGHGNVDLETAHRLGMRVANVPEFSPYATAEYAVALILTLCRHLRQADQQVRANDFALEKLVGFNLHGKTVGIIGIGRVGEVVAQILHGFGCRLLGHDPQPRPELSQALGLRYVSLPELCAQADIITVHTPLTDETTHLLDEQVLGSMKRGVLLVNTSRGGVLDTAAAIKALESGQLGFLGLDVYEGEDELFFANHSRDPLRDQTFAHLLTLNNVLVTGHQAFLTREALTDIALAVVAAFDAWEQGRPAEHELRPSPQAEPVLS